MNGKRKNRLLPLLLFALAVPLAFLLFSWLFGARVDAENLRSTEEGIRRAAVQCYALEGVYPPDLSYLEERYGVSVDEKRYYVDYQYVASNLMPDITVVAASS